MRFLPECCAPTCFGVGSGGTIRRNETALNSQFSMTRIYTDPQTGRELPSVTTILDATMSGESRAKLGMHYANNPKAFIQNVESQRRGDQIDAWAKAFLLGQDLPAVDHQFNPWKRQLQPLLEFVTGSTRAIFCDRVVYDRGRGYAGTLDFVAAIEGQLTVFDIKTKTRIWQPAIEDALLQVTAYKEAMETEGYEVGAIAVVVVTDRQQQVFKVDNPSELAALSQAWAMRLQQYGCCDESDFSDDPTLIYE